MSAIESVGDNQVNVEVAKNETNAGCPENQTGQYKDAELVHKVTEYEDALIKEKLNVSNLQKDLQARTDERDNLKAQVTKLEKELAKNSLTGSKDQNVTSDDDMVTKARSMIFEKTKVCKNQELQIEAFAQQVSSLKEIVSITKDMLEIRNMEVKQLQDQLSCLELKFTAEKDRHTLIHTKLERMTKLNEELKTEYEKQFALFTELQKAYKKKLDVPAGDAEKPN